MWNKHMKMYKQFGVYDFYNILFLLLVTLGQGGWMGSSTADRRSFDVYVQTW
jgi:hypothetical protein